MKKQQAHRRKHPRWYYLKWIFRQYRKHHRMILLLLFLTIISTVLKVLFPVVFKYIVDDLVASLKLFKANKIDMAGAEASRNQKLLLLLALGLGPVFAGIYTFCRAHMNIFFEKYYREQYFQEVMGKPHRFFLTFRTGDLVTRLTEDVRTWPPGLAWLCCSGIFRAVNSASLIIFCLISMFLLKPKLALVAMVPLPFMMYIFWKTEASIEGVFKAYQQGISETNDFLESGYSGIRIIKSFNGENTQSSLFGKLMQKRINLDVGVEKVHGLFMIYFEFLNYVGEVLVLLFGGVLVIRGELTLGTYYAFLSYLAMIVFPLMDIPMLLVTLAQSFITIDRLEEIEATEPPLPVTEGGKKIAEIATLEFADVSFRHKQGLAKEGATGQPGDISPSSTRHLGKDNQATDSNEGQEEAVENVHGHPFLAAEQNLEEATEQVLASRTTGQETDSNENSGKKPLQEQEGFAFKTVSFKLRRGEKVAVVGRIGSGKTTLLNLVAGVFTPTGGIVMINGERIQELNMDSVRDKIGYIQQEPTVFSETIATNIDFWRQCEMDWIESSARLAQFDEEIRGFPGQFEEKVGQRGVTLSGGQRQRLSIARALAGKPELLLMDDVTSSLDAANEQQLWQDLHENFPHITCLIVTHRLSTAQNADRIMVLANGRIDAIGTHQELMETNEIYQELVHA